MSEGLRVLVCGGRDYSDAVVVGAWLGAIEKKWGIAVIIHGDARGADTLAKFYGEFRRLQVSAYPADWRRYGRSAGPIRNEFMLRDSKPDLVVAFPGGAGTADMVRRAKAADVSVMAINRVAPLVPMQVYRKGGALFDIVS